MVLDVRGRIAKYLLDNVKPSGTSVALAFTQDDLAAAVGSTRVTVNKVLAGFEGRGLVRLGRRQIDVLSVEGLRAEVRD
jgi:CRP-like cAMP-binding protein